MRVVSLAPNITQIIKYIGGEDKLVGHTHYTEVEESEVVGGWLDPNYDKIGDLEPDVIFTSDLLQRQTKRDLEDDFKVEHSEPSSVQDLFPLMENVGETIGVETEKSIEELKSRLDSVEKYVEENVQSKPIVYCEEWNDPPMVAGNWVPDVIEIAGGSYPFLETGERSRKMTKEEFNSENIDYFVSHICGFGLTVNCQKIIDRDWNTPEEIYIFHDDLLNQLSPRLIEGVECICHIIHGYPIEETSSFEKCA